MSDSHYAKDPGPLGVAALAITCEAAPTQAEGTLSDGRYFYFRARHRSIELRVADESANAAVMSSNAVALRLEGFEDDGHPLSFMYEEEVRPMIAFLARIVGSCEEYGNR